jgi:nucleoside-diphosphate-sugar epimerase
MVFGPGDVAVLPAFQSARRGLGVDFGGAYSMIHVEDLAELLRVVAVRGEVVSREGALGRGVYFGADERAPTPREFWDLIGGAVGNRVRVLPVPRLAVHALGAFAEVAGRLGATTSLMSRDKAKEATAGNWVCSPAKARALGWAPQPLTQRLAETAAWYRQQGMLA